MEGRRWKKEPGNGHEISQHLSHISLGTQRLVGSGVGNVSLGNEVIPSEPIIGGPTPVDEAPTHSGQHNHRVIELDTLFCA